MAKDFDPFAERRAFIPVIRRELSMLGIEEMVKPEDVEAAIAQKGTMLLFVNCDDECAAEIARPAVALALQHEVLPDRFRYVFAGQNLAAAAKARSFFKGHFPTSPQIALLKDGEVVHMCDRDDLEKRLRSPEKVAEELTAAFEKHCGRR